MTYIALLMAMLAMLISVFTAVALRNHIGFVASLIKRARDEDYANAGRAAAARHTAYNEEEERIRAENIMAERRKELAEMGVIIFRDHLRKKNGMPY